MLREGCKSVSLVAAHLLLHRTTFSPSLNRCSPARLLPTHLSFSLSLHQVWYLSGWVCYLQLEKAKEQRGSEGRTVAEKEEEEEEESKALTEAARSYLTSAKKVTLVTWPDPAGRQEVFCVPSDSPQTTVWAKLGNTSYHKTAIPFSFVISFKTYGK